MWLFWQDKDSAEYTGVSIVSSYCFLQCPGSLICKVRRIIVLIELSWRVNELVYARRLENAWHLASSSRFYSFYDRLYVFVSLRLLFLALSNLALAFFTTPDLPAWHPLITPQPPICFLFLLSVQCSVLLFSKALPSLLGLLFNCSFLWSPCSSGHCSFGSSFLLLYKLRFYPRIIPGLFFILLSTLALGSPVRFQSCVC